jgi:hypothetical protein
MGRCWTYPSYLLFIVCLWRAFSDVTDKEDLWLQLRWWKRKRLSDLLLLPLPFRRQYSNVHLDTPD